MSNSSLDPVQSFPCRRGLQHKLSLENLEIGPTNRIKMPKVLSIIDNVSSQTEKHQLKGTFVTYAPDGGYGWVIVAASFLSNFVLDGVSLCPGVLQSVIQQASGKIPKPNRNTSNWSFANDGEDDQYEISVAMYSLVGSILLAMQLLVGPVISLMTDRFGFRAVAMTGSITASLGIFLSWACSPSIPNIWVLLIFYGLVTGTGFGMMFQPSIIIVALYFEKNRSLATGIAICGTGVGSILFPIMMNAMSDWSGWQGAFLLQSGIVLFSASFGFFYRPLPTKFVQYEEKGPKCEFPKEENEEEIKCLPMVHSMAPLFKSPTFIILAISGAITTLGFFAPYAFVPDKGVKELNMSVDSAVFAVTTIGIANTIGRLIFGYIADRPCVNKLILSNAALTIGGVATFLCPFMTSEYQLYIYVIIFGVTTAIFAVLRSVLILKFMGMVRFNNAFGLALMFMGVTTLIGNPIGGLLKDFTGRYDYSFYAAGAYFIISGLMCYPLQCVSNWEKNRETLPTITINH